MGANLAEANNGIKQKDAKTIASGTNRPAWSPFGNRHPICIAGKIARLHAAKHDPNRIS